MYVKKCPGSVRIRRPMPEYVKCWNCGKEVEIWTDEIKAECGTCRKTVFREKVPSCIEWCQYAEECIGGERYKELMGGMDEEKMF